MIIYLGPTLLPGSSGLPENFKLHLKVQPRVGQPLFPYLALHHAGFSMRLAVTGMAGSLLHHLFTLTPHCFVFLRFTKQNEKNGGGGIFSVALSFGFPQVGVTDRVAPRLRILCYMQKIGFGGSTIAQTQK